MDMENLNDALRKTAISSTNQSMHVEKITHNGLDGLKSRLDALKSCNANHTCSDPSDSTQMENLHGLNGASGHHLSNNRSAFLSPPRKHCVEMLTDSNQIDIPETSRRRTLSDTYSGHEGRRPWIIKERGLTSIVCSPCLTHRHIPRDPVQPQHGSLSHGVSGE